MDIYLSEKEWLCSTKTSKHKIRIDRFIGDGSDLEFIGNIDEVEITDRE